jgi:hypothetical protein
MLISNGLAVSSCDRNAPVLQHGKDAFERPFAAGRKRIAGGG